MHPVAQRLFVDGVEQDVARAVGRVIGAGGLVAAKTALGDAAVGRAAKHAPHLFIGVQHIQRIFHQNLDGILVAQPIGAFDGVEHV